MSEMAHDCCKTEHKHTPKKAVPAGVDLMQVEHTCPMHPEVRQMGPGSCPICGMALEPVTAIAGHEDNTEYRDMLRRFWVSAALSLPLLIITMGNMHFEGRKIVEILLSTPVVL